MTLRGRVVAASVGVLVIALVGMVAAFNVLLASGLASDASGVLRNRAAAQLATIDFAGSHVTVEEPPSDAELDHQAWVYADGRALERPTASPPEVERAVASLVGARGSQERSVSDTTRLLAVPLRDPHGTVRGTVVVGVSLVPYAHTRRIALIASVALSLVLLVVALVVVRAAVRMALRPVGEMTRRAADWSEHDLHRRFHLGPPRDELTALAATFDALLRRIEAVLRHEQRLTAEIAHELRTPLTTIRGELELALARREPSTETLTLVHEEAQRMERVIQTLLTTARAEAAQPLGSCALLPPIRDAIGAVSGAAASRGIEIALDAEREDLTADADPGVVSQSVYPLLENAVRHARTRIIVRAAAQDDEVTIVVSDDGPGVDGSDVFGPGISTTGGAGLGLPLARRLARSCGGEASLLDSSGGAVFEIRLPGRAGGTGPAMPTVHPAAGVEPAMGR